MLGSDVIAERGSTFPAGIEVERHHDPDSGADTMTINMGPSHPSTHGVLRLVLELDGENVVKHSPFSQIQKFFLKKLGKRLKD